MSEQKPSLKQQFHQAHELITAQRYADARKLLQEIDDPQAEVWLKQLEDKQKQSIPSTLFSPMMLLFGISAIIIGLGLVLAFMYVPPLIEAVQPNETDQYIDEMSVSDDEIIYSHIAGYCYHITGYGGELCLDWADLVMGDYNATAVSCVTPYIDTGLLDDLDYSEIGLCLTGASVPDPL